MKSEHAHDWLFLAGVGNSGANHWQRQWEIEHPNTLWLEHRDWDNPTRNEWVADLQQLVLEHPRPMVVVAHSLGCLLLLEWAAEHAPDKVLGAFLVAVPDPKGENFPAEAIGFRPAHMLPAALPMMIVASENDPYGTLGYAELSARQLGCECVNVGAQGHINGKSELGYWHPGYNLLQDFTRSLTA
ncbi:RBBP9/YdeN family alpha/beta hydrolase [Pseudomonas citri]|uniref:RBBP9/YdeN family alpha/beta hydrolase n=1 Tax=Pseudomonas citri TaxID=2978349 RepID=UPI0021B5B99A|nr:alpha/beta hydrolase [Pseudomonas citri]